jgi:hypothetical protein
LLFKEKKKKRGNRLFWMMKRNREDIEVGVVGSSKPSKRYAPIPLTCTRRLSGLLPSLEICGSATAHLSVPHILRRRKRRHNPSWPILFTQRYMRQMGRWSSLQKESIAHVANLPSHSSLPNPCKKPKARRREEEVPQEERAGGGK